MYIYRVVYGLNIEPASGCWVMMILVVYSIHVSAILKSLHWLKVNEYIYCKAHIFRVHQVFANFVSRIKS